MSEHGLTAREFLDKCKAWGFKIKRGAAGDHMILEAPNGEPITVRQVGEINDYGMQQVTRNLGITRQQFLVGPKKPKKVITSPRRKLVAYLVDHQLRVEDAHGYLTSHVAQALGTPANALRILLSRMEEDGQIGKEVRDKRTFAIWLNPDAPGVREMWPEPEMQPLTGPGLGAVPVSDGSEAPITPAQPLSAVSGLEEASSGPSEPALAALAGATMEDLADALLQACLQTLRDGSKERLEAQLEEMSGRLGQQVEYVQTLRAKIQRLESERDDLRRQIGSQQALITSLRDAAQHAVDRGSHKLTTQVIKDLELAIRIAGQRNRSA